MQMLFGPPCDCDPDKDMDCGLTGCCGGANLGIVRSSDAGRQERLSAYDLKVKDPPGGHIAPPWVRGKKK